MDLDLAVRLYAQGQNLSAIAKKLRVGRHTLTAALRAAGVKIRSNGPVPHAALRPEELDRIFWSKVQKTESCWLWTDRPTTAGYGLFSGPNGRVYAHRWSYERFVGPIGAGLVIDHLCRNTRCVRPDHLQPVAQATNVERGTSGPARNMTKTHCPKGHLLSGANVRFRVTASGRRWRRCLACERRDA